MGAIEHAADIFTEQYNYAAILQYAIDWTWRWIMSRVIDPWLSGQKKQSSTIVTLYEQYSRPIYCTQYKSTTLRFTCLPNARKTISILHRTQTSSSQIDASPYIVLESQLVFSRNLSFGTCLCIQNDAMNTMYRPMQNQQKVGRKTEGWQLPHCFSMPEPTFK